MGVVKGSFLVLVVMYIVVTTTPKTEAALNCGQVTSTLAPCLGYLRSGGPTVPVPCCNGVRSLYGAAQTTPDRQTACNCLKQTANAMTGSINLNAAASLPGKCSVNIPYKISPSTDCSKVV